MAAWIMRACAGVVFVAACSGAAQPVGPRGAPPAATSSAGTAIEPSAGTTSLPLLDASFGNPEPIDASVATGPCGAMPCIDAGPPRVPDDDGFTVAEGDCDDFSVLVNPGAYDVPNNGIDEDCQGGDATSDACDEMLAIDASDPFDAARAMELCAKSEAGSRRWGVMSARWTTPDGRGKPMSHLMHGILSDFGPAFGPRGGTRLLALSSGVARAPTHAGYTQDCSDTFPADSTDFPDRFNGTSSSCEAGSEATDIVDAIALELEVRMPSNATSISFDSAFFTEEYPDFICTPFNDYFQVITKPVRAGGKPDGNVVFDLDDNAVSVNNSLLRVCDAGEHGGKSFACPLGWEPLRGTGYEDCGLGPDIDLPGGIFGGGGRDVARYGASTGWLNTEFAVQPGEQITFRLTIWDSGDSALDSLAIIDHFRFKLRDAPPPPEKPMTTPVIPD